MKSCFGTLLLILTIVVVLGGSGLIWYFSSHTEFTRKDAKAGASNPTSALPKATPRAVPVR